MEHGTLKCYQDGCHCKPCTEANRDYMREYRDRQRVTALPDAEYTSGPAEQAVLDETDGLSAATSYPTLVAQARQMARVLDNPKCVTSHAACNRQLTEVMDRLRKASEGRKGRLADVRKLHKVS